MLLQFAGDKMGVEVGYLNIYTAGVDIIKWDGAEIAINRRLN
jgi:hypothetical protein